MSLVQQEITTAQIKDYVTSSKSSRITVAQGCTLESKFGRAALDFNQVGQIEQCQIYVKRLSGNGKFLVQFDSADPELWTASSQISQTLLLKPRAGLISKIEFFRPKESTGEINIFGFVLFLAAEGFEVSNNWKVLISQGGLKHSGLRLVGQKLFAAQGAYLESGNIINKLETFPVGVWTRQGDQIKFLAPCEVTALDLNLSQSLASVESKPMYEHRELPTPILNSPVIFEVSSVISNPIQPKLVESLVTVFDSQFHRSFDHSKNMFLTNKQVKLVNSNAKDYLIIKRGGVFTMPISELKANSDYQIELTLQKIGGNGRIHVGIVPEQNSYPTRTEICLAEAIAKPYLCRLSTDTGSNFKLKISMYEDGVGEVLVSKIVVTKKVLKEFVPAISSLPINSYLQYFNSKLETSPEEELIVKIKTATQQASLLEVQPPNLHGYLYPEVGNIEATYHAGKLWLSRVLGYFPKVKPVRLGVSSWKTLATPSATTLLTSLETLPVAVGDRVWLEAFLGGLPGFAQQILSQAETILTPSLPNYLELKAIFPTKEILRCPLAWPYTQKSDNAVSSGILYFEQDLKYTKFLIRAWQPAWPQLTVVGTSLRLPNNIKMISEYQSHSEILRQLAQANMLIELSKQLYYDSGLLDLARSLQVPVITNNLNYSSKLGVNVIRSDVNYMLDSEHFRVTLENNLHAPSNFGPSGNTANSLQQTMQILLGVSC